MNVLFDLPKNSRLCSKKSPPRGSSAPPRAILGGSLPFHSKPNLKVVAWNGKCARRRISLIEAGMIYRVFDLLPIRPRFPSAETPGICRNGKGAYVLPLETDRESPDGRKEESGLKLLSMDKGLSNRNGAVTPKEGRPAVRKPRQLSTGACPAQAGQTGQVAQMGQMGQTGHSGQPA